MYGVGVLAAFGLFGGWSLLVCFVCLKDGLAFRPFRCLACSLYALFCFFLCLCSCLVCVLCVYRFVCFAEIASSHFDALVSEVVLCITFVCFCSVVVFPICVTFVLFLFFFVILCFVCGYGYYLCIVSSYI